VRASVHVGEGTSRKSIATEALLAGLRRIGISHELRSLNDAPARTSDFALVWGHKHRVCTIARSCGFPLLVVERPFFGDRAKNYSLTWNWAHRLGIRPPPGDSHRPQPTLDPWTKRDSGSIVVFDQVPTDIMFQDVAGSEWAERVARDAERFWNRDAFVRPHPQVRQTCSLEQDLRSAWMGISYTSTAAVGCVAAGVPCVAVNPKSMAYDVCSAYPQYRLTPDREEWAHWLSWCQWNGSELEDGTALKHVLKAYDAAKEKTHTNFKRSDADGNS